MDGGSGMFYSERSAEYLLAAGPTRAIGTATDDGSDGGGEKAAFARFVPTLA